MIKGALSRTLKEQRAILCRKEGFWLNLLQEQLRKNIYQYRVLLNSDLLILINHLFPGEKKISFLLLNDPFVQGRFDLFQKHR